MAPDARNQSALKHRFSFGNTSLQEPVPLRETNRASQCTVRTDGMSFREAFLPSESGLWDGAPGRNVPPKPSEAAKKRRHRNRSTEQTGSGRGEQASKRKHKGKKTRRQHEPTAQQKKTRFPDSFLCLVVGSAPCVVLDLLHGCSAHTGASGSHTGDFTQLTQDETNLKREPGLFLNSFPKNETSFQLWAFPSMRRCPSEKHFCIPVHCQDKCMSFRETFFPLGSHFSSPLMGSMGVQHCGAQTAP